MPEVKTREANIFLEFEFPVPPSLLWEYLTKPEYRAIVLGASRVELLNLAQVRSAVDPVYYCYHGNMKSNQCIVDWQPFEEYTIDSATPIGVNFNMTFKLEPVKDGTHLINLWGKARGAWMMSKISDLLQKLVFVSDTDKGMERLRQRIQQDLADGTAFVSPPIEVEKAQLASLATQTLTREHLLFAVKCNLHFRCQRWNNL